MHAYRKIPYAGIQQKKKTQRCSALKPSIFSLLGRRVHVKQNEVLQHPSETAADSAKAETGLCTLFASNAAE